MKSNWLLLLVGGLSVVAPTAARAQGPNSQSMVVTNVTGNLHIEQDTPSVCSTVDTTTPVLQGRLEIGPGEGIDYGTLKYFVLTGGSVSFVPFPIHVTCLAGTVSRTRTYSEVAVQLSGGPTDFLGFPSTPGAYDITIPRQKVLLREAAIVNGELEAGFKRPKEDITGVIDLAQGTVQMQVVVGTKIHFEWPSGCSDNPVVPCIIPSQDRDGTLTATLSGTIVFPDTDGDGVPDRNDNCPFVANREQERVPPIIRVPAVVTVASCVAPRIGPVLGWDICRDLPATVTNDAPDPFRPGPNAVTWTAVDGQGHVSTSRQTVTVVDTTPPVFTSLPVDLTRNDCGPVPLGVPTAEDDCEESPIVTGDAPASFPVGETDVTWTAMDKFGNRATATQTVTVEDSVAPEAACLPDGRSFGYFQVSASDSCTGSPTIRLGEFVLANGETIWLRRTLRPGVRLARRAGADGVKHFLVGPDDVLITARDQSGNVDSAVCPVP